MKISIAVLSLVAVLIGTKPLDAPIWPQMPYCKNDFSIIGLCRDE